MKITVDRSKWARGKMLTDDGAMCVLGFIGKAYGVPDDVLHKNVEALVWSGVAQLPHADLWPDFVRKPLPDAYGASPFWRYVMNVNDAAQPDSWREYYIGRAFAATDVEVEFIDGATQSEGDPR